MLLVHEEDDNGEIIPTWIAADPSTVKTTREIFNDFRKRGYSVEYFRIPISPDQNIEDNYLDEYVKIIKDIDPSTGIVFNCGMGVVRTTFGMIVAQIIRRAQLLAAGKADPFQEILANPTGTAMQTLKYAQESQKQNKAMLRLVYILEQALGSDRRNQKSAIEVLLGNFEMADSLKAAILGNYHAITGLNSVIESGASVKKLLDELIDQSDAVINLREDILLHRMFAATNGAFDRNAYQHHLSKALAALERYFFLVAFTAYVNEDPKATFELDFSDWLEQRSEIWHMLQNLRTKGDKLYIFGPVSDLSIITSGTVDIPSQPFVRDKWSEYFVQNRAGAVLRSGMILKIDLWSDDGLEGSSVHGAVNFRRIDETNFYAVAQPTTTGIRNVIERVQQGHDQAILWINLREEPFLYINEIPYVLRQEKLPRRNIKSYVGISDKRLELVEERLKADIAKEGSTHDGKLLLHSETPQGDVVPVWEDVTTALTMKEVMAQEHPNVKFQRVPITAEHPPHYDDMTQLVNAMLSTDLRHTSVILNCQMGKGRSTTASVIVLLISKWLRSHAPPSTPLHDRLPLPEFQTPSQPPRSHGYNYQVINSLLRVIRNGLEVKRTVDAAIDLCGSCLNLRDSIEEYRQKAEDAGDNKAYFIKRGVQALRRYFQLIVFQAYLDQTPPDTLSRLDSFESWVRKRKELRTIRKDLEGHATLKALIPLEKVQPGDGVALTDEVLEVVARRNGATLMQNTILKADFFPGLIKLGLAERIDGAANFRKVSLSQVRAVVAGASTSMVDSTNSVQGETFVCGVGMPSLDGFLRVLDRMDAGPNGSNRIMWTSLREEPVIYVNGKPFVLRVLNDPIKNLETTGIAKERVEAMENSLKADVLRESKTHDGRVLLHDEEADGQTFAVVPVWETVQEDGVLTPADVFELARKKGYKVDYIRIPITDEQSPIPEVFDALLHRTKEGLQKDASLVYNCQMGRGRTTTGVVVAMLIASIVDNDDVFTDQMSGSIIQDNADDSASSESEAYLNGEYRLVLQLLSVLKYGRLAKNMTDKAVDLAQHIQNLRRAVYDYKLRAESMDETSAKYHTTFEVGMNYLIRYFYLIAFAEYLLEMEADHETQSFASWIRSRREVGNILAKKNLDFS